MGANDNHTDGIFWVISWKTAHKRKFIKTSFIVVVLKDIVPTSLFYTSFLKDRASSMALFVFVVSLIAVPLTSVPLIVVPLIAQIFF